LNGSNSNVQIVLENQKRNNFYMRDAEHGLNLAQSYFEHFRSGVGYAHGTYESDHLCLQPCAWQKNVENIAQLIDYWPEEGPPEEDKFALEYVRKIHSPVLMAFSWRAHQYYVDRPMSGFSGCDCSPTSIKVWFVAYGIGRFALDLRHVTSCTAKTFNFLQAPIEYLAEDEDRVLKEHGIVPLVDILWNRRGEGGLPTEKEAEANGFAPLPKTKLKVQYFEDVSEHEAPEIDLKRLRGAALRNYN